MNLLSPDGIATRLAELDDWQQVLAERKGNEIVRTIRFDSFLEAIAFVNRVADAAEEADHHPDILIEYRNVTLRLSTHSEGGLTSKDFDLASRADALVSA